MYLVVGGTDKKVVKSLFKVFAESWSVHIFLLTELVSGLANNRVNHIESWYLVLWGTLMHKKSVKNKLNWYSYKHLSNPENPTLVSFFFFNCTHTHSP